MNTVLMIPILLIVYRTLSTVNYVTAGDQDGRLRFGISTLRPQQAGRKDTAINNENAAPYFTRMILIFFVCVSVCEWTSLQELMI